MDKVMYGLQKIREITAKQPEALGSLITKLESVEPEHKRLNTGSGFSCQVIKFPRRSAVVVMTFCLMIAGVSGAQENRPYHVLVLNSYHPTYNWTRLVMEGIESEFGQCRNKVELDIEYMDTQWYKDEGYFQNLYVLYKNKTQFKKYDIVIVCDNNALDFLVRYRNDLYPDIPVVFCQ